MSTRVQTFGRRSGFGNAADAGPMGECVSALLRLNTLDQLARIALSQIDAHFACRALRVTWQLGTNGDAASPLHCIPESGATAAETALIEAALTAHGEVRAVVPGSDQCRVANVLAAGITASVVLLCEWPSAAASAQAGPEWHEYLSLLGARFADVLERAEQGLAIERLDKTARLQRALYAIADLAGADLDMPEMLGRLHAVVGELMYAENFFIALYNAERDTLQFIYFADTRDPSVVDPDEEIPVSSIRGSLTLEVIRRGRPIMGPSARLRDEFGFGPVRNYGPDAADWLGVPMVSGGAVRGAVVVQ